MHLRAGDIVTLCVLALLCIGVVMVRSAGLSVGDDEQVTLASIVFSRSAAYAALAMLALFIASRGPVHRVLTAAVSPARRPLAVLWAGGVSLALLCMLVYIPGLGREVNGAHRWLGLPIPGAGLVSFQPSELAKWALVALMAGYAASRAAVMRSFLSGLLPGLAVAGLLAAVIAREDLGTAVLIGATSCVILIAGGARLVGLLALAPVAAAGFVIAVLAEPYRMRRLTSFMDPFADPDGAGYHMIQSMVAVANGEIFGRGLGFGLQKFGYLPEDRTDFLFAVICEELGLAGAGAVMALYLGLLWAGWSVVRAQANIGVRLAGLGVLVTIGFQALINLCAVTGLGPTKGIALPLLSAGGTGWILTAASLGLLVGMDRAAESQPAAAASEPGPAAFAPIHAAATT